MLVDTGNTRGLFRILLGDNSVLNSSVNSFKNDFKLECAKYISHCVQNSVFDPFVISQSFSYYKLLYCKFSNTDLNSVTHSVTDENFRPSLQYCKVSKKICTKYYNNIKPTPIFNLYTYARFTSKILLKMVFLSRANSTPIFDIISTEAGVT